MLNMIFAISSNGMIGYNGGLPWPFIKEDMKWFKDHTKGQIVVMGRTTWNSLGKNAPLKDRFNIVVSSTPAPGADVTITLDETVKREMADVGVSLLKESIMGAARAFDAVKQVFVIGGKKLYDEMLPYVDNIYLTTIHGEFNGDTQLDVAKYLENTTREEYTHMYATNDRPALDFAIYRKNK